MNNLRLQTFIAFLFVLLGFTTIGQDKWLQGKFPSRYFSETDLGTSPQVLAAEFGPQNQIYIGNNQNILKFNGVSWTKIQLEENDMSPELRESVNKSRVNRIYHTKGDKLFVARQNSFGYVQHNALGEEVYHPLYHKPLGEKFRGAYKIVELDNGDLLLLTFKNALQIKGDKVAKHHFPRGYETATCAMVTPFFKDFLVRMIRQDENGDITDSKYFILRKSTGEFETFEGPAQFNDKKWEHTFKSGDWNYLADDKGHFVKFKKKNSGQVKWEAIEKGFHGHFLEGQINYAQNWRSYLVFGTSNQGVLMLNSKGEIIRQFDTADGMETNVVEICLFDHQNNLWVFLDNGVHFLELSSPISSFEKNRGVIANVQAVYVDEEVKLLGTSIGLLQDYKDNYRTKFKDNGSFNRVIFDFQKFSTDYGERYFVIDEFSIFEYFPKSNTRKFIADAAAYSFFQSKADPNIIYYGHLDGIAQLTVEKNGVKNENVLSGIGGDVLKIVGDKEHLYFGAFAKGLFTYNIKSGAYSSVELKKAGAKKSYYTPALFQGDLLVGCQTGVYQLKEGKLLPFEELDGMLQGDNNFGVHRMINEQDQRLWIIWFVSSEKQGSQKFTGYLTKENGKYAMTRWPFRIVDQAGIMNDIFFENEQDVWMGGFSGVYFFNLAQTRRIKRSFKVFVDEIYANNEIYCYAPEKSTDLVDIPYSKNSLKLVFHSNSYYGLGNMEYAYKIGNEPWSEYSTENTASFPKLYEGNYTIQIKARDIYTTESDLYEWTIRVLPPWYRSWYAYLMYVALLVLLIVLVSKISTQRIKRQNQRLEQTVKERTKEIAEQNEQLEEQKAEITRKSNDILDSIKYAKRIQDTILPSDTKMNALFEDHFVLYLPKDIVSGDFYWASEINGESFFAAVDCTGHGVPGALVSIVGNNGLIRSTNEFQLSEPASILDKLRELVVQSFKAEGLNDVKDGMDIALCSINRTTNTLKYAGANNECVIIRNKEVIQLTADKQPIGQFINEKPFSQKEFPLEKGDCIYVFSDGYVDQFGGPKGKKFKSRPFRNLLAEIHDLPMNEQYDRVLSAFNSWKGDHEQIDDVCVIGVRV